MAVNAEFRELMDVPGAARELRDVKDLTEAYRDAISNGNPEVILAVVSDLANATSRARKIMRGAGYAKADTKSPRCDHGYRLTDNCPCC